jgi:hypothetical protein
MASPPLFLSTSVLNPLGIWSVTPSVGVLPAGQGAPKHADVASRGGRPGYLTNRVAAHGGRWCPRLGVGGSNPLARTNKINDLAWRRVVIEIIRRSGRGNAGLPDDSLTRLEYKIDALVRHHGKGEDWRGGPAMALRIEPEIVGVAIVLRGSFNPSIFQPFWMAKQGLITDEAAESATVGVIHQEISQFAVESEFILNVQTDRFQISRATAPLITVCDLCSRIFGDILPHTPITQLGINRSVHFSVGSMQERDRIGRLIAPQDIWGDFGEGFNSDDPLKRGGLQTMTMINKKASDREAGWIQARIEPSQSIGKGETSIFMEINDHYQMKDTNDAIAVMRILQDRFDASIANADKIIDQIMSLKS